MNTDLRYVVPLNERTVLYVSPDKDGSGPWLWAFDVERRSAHRISFGLERYTSLSVSSDGRRLVATVSNPSATLWSVPILNRTVEERDVSPYPVPTIRALGAALRRIVAVLSVLARHWRWSVAQWQRRDTRNLARRRRYAAGAARAVPRWTASQRGPETATETASWFTLCGWR